MTRLAIVGASVRAAAQSALRAGFDVVGADLFADADLDGVCPITKIKNYPEGLADWLAEQRVDAWMYTGALENYPALVVRMAQIAPLWGVSGETLRRVRQPLWYSSQLAEAGVRVPALRRLSDHCKRDGDWLAKTYRHSSGTGVWRLKTAADWQRAREADAYAQQLIPGQSMSAVFAVGSHGSALLGVTKQQIGDDWGYRGSISPIDLKPHHKQQVDRLGRCLVEFSSLRGLVGIDLVVDEHDVWVIEINPRYTASVEVLERATGCSAISAHTSACRDETVADWVPTVSTVGKRIVYASRRVTITAELSAWMQAEKQKEKLADRPRQGVTIEAGQPVCTLFDSGTDIGQLERSLSERADLISLATAYVSDLSSKSNDSRPSSSAGRVN